MKVRGTKDIQEYRDEVICKLNLAYKKLNNLGNDPMQALFRLRYEQIGFRPLRDGNLMIAEQMNQSFHVLAVFAGAEIVFREIPGCGALSLSPGPEGGLDIESDEPGLAAAEVFSTGNPEFLRNKLRKDASGVKEARGKNDVPFVHRFVFFYYSKMTNLNLVESVKYEFPEVRIHPLNWNEMMGGNDAG